MDREIAAEPLDICLRADASPSIGAGHLTRSLTLARELRSRRAGTTLLACRAGDHERYVERLPEAVVLIRSGDDAQETIAALTHARLARPLVIVDGYRFDATWHRAVRPHAALLVAVDDLADRPFECDLVVDQNLPADDGARYRPLVPPETTVLTGPAHALLRPEFRRLRQALDTRDRGTDVREVVIFFGGGDNREMLKLAVSAAAKGLSSGVTITAIGVGAHEVIDEIRGELAGREVNAVPATDRMAEILARADIAIGAGGSHSWERCALGLPAITVALAANQLEVCRAISAVGAARFLGPHESVSVELLASAVRELAEDSVARTEMAKRAFSLTDGAGAARVADAVEHLLARPAGRAGS